MRPAGEVRVALIQAAHDIVAEMGHPQPNQPLRGATLAEMCARAQVGRDCARSLVPKIKKSGALEIVGYRRVEYRNRPVAEYTPAQPSAGANMIQHGWVDLGHCMADWVR